MRLPLIEALSVERIPEPQQRVVQMMPQLVKQRPEKGAKRDDALLLRRPHPERDQRGITFPLRGFVESVQLAPPGVRPRGEHLHAHGGRAERPGQRGGQKLTSALSHRALAALARPAGLHYAAADHGINEGSGGRSAWWGGMPWEATGSRLGMADPPRSSWKPAST